MSGVLRPQLWGKDDVITKGLMRPVGHPRGAPKSCLRMAAGMEDARISIMPRGCAQHNSEGRNRREKGNRGTLDLFSDPKSSLWFRTIILFSSVNRKLFMLFYRSMSSLHMVYICTPCFWCKPAFGLISWQPHSAAEMLQFWDQSIVWM